MKVLLRRNVSKVGQIGQVVTVKPGYARNYLLPQGLAVAPTDGNLKAIEAEMEAYLEQVAKDQAEMAARAQLVDGKEVTIPSRANEEGHLYGSVGPAQIAAALAAERVFLEPEQIILDSPIRQLDKYDLKVRFSEDVSATIHVWIVPIRGADEDAEAEQAYGEDEPSEEGFDVVNVDDVDDDE